MELIDGHYHIGGIAVSDIVALDGAPVYVYNAAIIKRQVNRLRNAFGKTPVRIMFACKALTNINILRYARTLGVGLDTVSIQEVELGLLADFTPSEILYTPNMVSYAEIRKAIEFGVHINIDTISVLERFGHDYADRVPVCIRINPHIMAGGNERISTGHIDSKFGISVHQIRHVERIVKSNTIHVNGLHMHTGSDILDADVFIQGAEILLDVAERFPEVRFLDFGSGFKVPYKPDDVETDIETFGLKLSSRIDEFNRGRITPIEIWFEPGKYIVSEAGIFLAPVNVVKQTTSTVFAGVDSGLNHLIRPMLYGSYHHIVNTSNPNGTPRIYTVVGYICETDTFGWDRKINEVREGDILAFYNAGAYGYAMASNYNSRYRPSEVFIRDGRAHVIRRRETMDDLLSTQIDQGDVFE